MPGKYDVLIGNGKANGKVKYKKQITVIAFISREKSVVFYLVLRRVLSTKL